MNFSPGLLRSLKGVKKLCNKTTVRNRFPDKVGGAGNLSLSNSPAKKRNFFSRPIFSFHRLNLFPNEYTT